MKPHKFAQYAKTFTIAGTFRIHMLIRNEENPHTCDQCIMIFTETVTMREHMLLHNRDTTQIWTFTEPGTLRTHMGRFPQDGSFEKMY